MKVKTTVRYHLTFLRMAVIKKTRNNKCWRGGGEREPLCTVGETANWCSHHGKQYGGPQKLKVELPYDAAIPILGIYLKKTKALNSKRYMQPYTQSR